MAIANESTRESSEMHHEAHSGPGKYVLVWIALMVLTVVTVVTGRMHLPNFGLLLALVIASVKGLLVLLYFMHLAEHQGANRLVIAVSIMFVALLIGFSLMDTATRFPLSNAQGSRLSDMPVTEDFLKAQFGEGAQDNEGAGNLQRRGDTEKQAH
jgi:cytochrome c oxidase subunit 4